MAKDILLNINIKENLKLKGIRLAFKKLVEECFADLRINEPILMEKFKTQFYYFDSVEMGTNTTGQFNINTLFVELKDITKSENSIDIRRKTLHNIKKYIFQLLVSKSSRETLLWQTKNFIHYRYYEDFLKNTTQTDNISSEKISNIQQETNSVPNNNDDREIFQFKIVIGESYKNKEKNLYGIRYYANNKYEVSIRYPKYAMEYYAYKNYETKNLYTKYVNIFKNITTLEKHETKPELIETIIYNVPNILFDKNPSFNSIRNIINHLRNKATDTYLTIDNQYFLYLSQNTNFDLVDLKNCIKCFENYYKHVN